MSSFTRDETLQFDDPKAVMQQFRQLEPASSWHPRRHQFRSRKSRPDERSLDSFEIGTHSLGGLGGQFQSFSEDGGATWSSPVLSQLTGTAAPVSISRVPTTGHLLAIWNRVRLTHTTAIAIR